MDTQRTVIDFLSPGEVEKWESLNDVVMGGVSGSHLELVPGEGAVFEGNVSLEHGGGFASVRTHPREFGLSGCDGVVIRVRGDGRRYRLRLRTDDDYEGVAYQSSFGTTPGQWEDVCLPFSAFHPSFRGQDVPHAPPLDPGRIRRFGFMIADRQAGPFRLEIGWVHSYGDGGP
jgi:monofunctional biosynthetic peptidoglycan transglycosylase